MPAFTIKIVGGKMRVLNKDKVINILKNNLIFIIGTILLVYKGLLLNYTLGLNIEKNLIIYTITAALLIMSPVINNRNKFGYIYFNTIYIVITLIIYANFLYYSYSTNFLSFYQIVNVKYAKEIGSGVLCIISLKSIVLFFIDNILALIFSILAYKRLEKTVYKNKVLKMILIVIIAILNIYIVTGNINKIYKEKGYNKSLIIQEASIYYYHYEDAKDYLSSIFVKEKIDEEKLKKSYEQNINEKAKSSIYTGTAKNSNVIILQLESLNEYIIGKKVNGKEITPNLNKFFKNNIYCSNMYNQGLGTTADSEFEMENSMYPLENGYVFQKYYGNTWLDIYSTLKKKRILYFIYAS